jgi:HK97 gp10 family phage protein
MTEIAIETRGVSQVVEHFERFGRDVHQRLAAAVAAEGIELVRAVQEDKLSGQMVGQVTRRLRDSIHLEMAETETSVTGTVGTNVSYARFVHDGTAPHVIEAKSAPALHFFMGGAEVFARRVNHPGTKPRPFLTSTLAEREAQIRARLAAAVAGDAGAAP